MGNINYTRVILGSLRYKSAPDTNLLFEVPLIQNTKQIVEFDRTRNVNLEQVFDDERQRSFKFRPTAKFSVLFNNAYSGYTNYPPFENNLYYVNEVVAATEQCTNGNSIAWTGFPQYNEFDFIRTDNNVSGYTQPLNPTPPYDNHINFVNKSASTYNWMYYMSYAYKNNFDKQIYAYDNKYNVDHSWVIGDGLPIVSEKTIFNGLPIISFRSPLKHGLSVGEFVKLSNNFIYNGNVSHQVFSLGDGFYGSEEYVFNIINPGFTGTTFSNGTSGLFKRFIIGTYSAESMSKYYVRTNKILTNLEDAVLVKAGFEQNIFGSSRKYESSGLTPNKLSRVSVKEGSQSYTLTFNTDIDIKGLIDNQQRPITELFFTVIWRGYFGWFLKDDNKLDKNVIKNGYEFNLPLINGQPNLWWLDYNQMSDAINLNYSFFQTNINNTPKKFYSTIPPKMGDIVDGDLCEWNDYTQEERVISPNYHKIRYNPNNFDISSTNPTNQLGFYYKPHHKITLSVYSDYIEESNPNQIYDVPDYSFYSTSRGIFIWRDIYTYGFIDSTGLGVDYPFLNGKHYPYESYFFRIIPEGTNYTEQDVINDPTIDNCE